MPTDRIYELPGGLTVTRTQPAIGAIVSGIDLGQPLDETQADGLRQALFAHGVIFLRGQEHIGFAEHLALAEAFGTPICDGPDPERPQITTVSAKAGSREGTASSWHSDGCYQPSPPSVSILRAIDPCTFGGDTCWASGVAAYAGLAEELKRQIDPLRFTTSLAARIPKNYNHFGTASNWEELNEKYPPITQPVVVVHPVTGARALYANSTWALGIEGMDEEKGQALIDRLSAEFTRPEYQMRWQWEKGAIAIWDNRIVQHYGVPDQTTDRYLERITVQGGPMLSVADWQARREKVPEQA
ncbi:MAG: TauD/TfdA family dioxygenase [Novosphingobium sp.]|nr:TauD/TfdA family dioxygenase [Novosphingobium sp.]MCP5402266.1 TauD/TfdA family dioxygenase [Novosphingobium sp.]